MFQPVERALSDHTPLRAQFENGKNILSYNMLIHMEYNKQWGFINNGFGATEESEALYIARIQETARKSSLYIAQHNPIALCFQEAPTAKPCEEFKASFPQEIHENYEFVIQEKENSDNCIMTLYDKKHYTFSNELTNQMKMVKLIEGLNGRCLAIVLIDNETKESTLIVNVHAIFAKYVINDVRSIYAKAKELNIDNIHFIGDFNRDILKQDNESKSDICDAVINNVLNIDRENTLFVSNIDSSSFIRSLREKLAKDLLPTESDLILKVETRDGILSTEKHQLSFIKELYLTNRTDLAPELSRLPVNFLNNISITNKADLPCQTSFTF